MALVNLDLDKKTRDMITFYFREYYKNYAVFDIPQINRREFGVGFSKKINARHLSFQTTEEFRKYLVTNVPFYVSHSAAYYEFPEARPIEKKHWLGADLIFDMDLAGGKYELYSNFEKIHDEVIRLVNDFLSNDFGIAKQYIFPVFSGSKGFHVHIRDKRFRLLGSNERREIVDYISGIGFSYLSLMNVEKIGRLQKITGPKPKDGGYPGRFARRTIEILKNNPKNILQRYYTKIKGKELVETIIRGINRGNWSFLPGREPLKLLKPVADHIAIKSIPLDASVSYDIRRLIRVPNSIHGGSGFIAKMIDIDKLESFNPFINAKMPNRSNWKIEFIEDVPSVKTEQDIEIGGYKKGQRLEMKDNEAVFYILKGSAKIIG